MIELAPEKDHPIIIPCGSKNLDGILHVPSKAKGIVLFAHGSGSSRLSSRNQYVASVLNEAKIATLLFDLLTPEEEVLDDQTQALRFDIHLLATRLVLASAWIEEFPMTHALSQGFFGASTGGAAALVAAANAPSNVKAIVSRGGRPDLADESLALVKAPVLLIVGGDDEPVITMNKEAFAKLNTIKKLEIIPGATHLFEEPGKLIEVARLAKDWFLKYIK